ncbi:MAG TPA: SRPBCC family protein [Casimicrobiaceae bacterium]|nr:SRPBCC family protein [Casimicrobiaceae bacterium]
MEVREGTRSYRDRADEWQAGGAWRRTEPVPAQQSRRGRAMDPRRLARGLGWFSLSLGLVEVLAPRFVSRLIGGRGDNTGLIRLYGMREIMSGMIIFGQGAKPAVGLWSRVAGDAIDIATLAAAASSSSTRKGPLAFATANVLGVTALDVYCAQELARQQPTLSAGTIRMSRSVVINRSPEDLYAFWHNFENFPRFMHHLESVRATGPRTSHWVAKGPAGTRVEWDAEITADTPNELIAWRSAGDADVDNSGIVQFERRPGGRGTIVRVEIEYRPPGGVAGAMVARLFNQSPEQQIYDDLHRMKQVIETGEVLRSDGSPEGTGRVLQDSSQPKESSSTNLEGAMR